MKQPMDRLRRVTDLFVEGRTLYLGNDDENKPVLVWVNKLNSFEVEESRRDAVSARGLRLLELEKEESPERMAMWARASRWTDNDLADNRVGQVSDEVYLDTINELESDESWREKIAMMKRLPELLDDDHAEAGDSRREQLTELNQEYLNELGDRLNKANDAKQNEIKQKILSDGRNAVLEDFMEAWRNRVSLDAFMQEKRATELYAAMRVCDATEDDRYDLGDQRHWVHRSCDHRLRMLDARAAVKLLPEELLGKVIEVLDGTTVPDREAGNSAAPESSSVSSEPADPAEASTPSTPDETQADVPTT